LHFINAFNNNDDNSLTIYYVCHCSHCDVNSPRRPGLNGEGAEEIRLVYLVNKFHQYVDGKVFWVTEQQ